MGKELYSHFAAYALDRFDSEMMHVGALEAFHAAEMNPFTLLFLNALQSIRGKGLKVKDWR